MPWWLQIVGGAALTAVGAQVSSSLPGSPVPVTAQTYMVLLTGGVLGARHGAASQLLYLLAAASGLPVLSEGSGGLDELVGPTGGYVLSFPLAAAWVGAMAGPDHQRGRPWAWRFGRVLAVMLLAGIPIFALGLANLARFVPGPDLLEAGMWPFLPGHVIKCVLGAVVVASFPPRR